ncbi:hypothetical protein, partial [Alteromonas sp. 14N.309.X.WAT.G.H12]|uniref:hypothetical protein n=1 Tax=Alteromonas sp. 14N.309.X.WAT.G.H12 TaxID=3120824 RepID=UPI002FD7983E
LGGPDLTDDAQDEQEAATEENDIDAVLGGPDLTDDAQDEQEAATEENDISDGASTEEEGLDVDALLSDFGEADEDEAEKSRQEDDALDLDSISGIDDELDSGTPKSPIPKLRETEEYSNILDDANSTDTKPAPEAGVEQKTHNVRSEPKSLKKGNGGGMRRGIGLVVATLLLAGPLGLAGGVYGPGLLEKAGVFSTGNDAPIEMDTTVKNLQEEIAALKSKLSTVTNENSNAIVALRTDVDAVKSAQMGMQGTQSQVTQKIGTLEDGMGQFELELVKRIEALLSLVESATESNRTISSDIKETVLREVVQLIEDGDLNGVNDKITKALTEFKGRANEVSQLQEMVTGLRNLTTMTNAELKYLNNRVAELEKQPVNESLGVTPSVQNVGKEEKVQLEPANPVSVYVENEQRIKAVEPVNDTAGDTEIERPPKQYLVGIHEVRKGDYTIYLQEEGASSTQFQRYRFAGTESSVVPGYGRITGVSKAGDNTRMVDYIVSTENGVIRGRVR